MKRTIVCMLLWVGMFFSLPSVGQVDQVVYTVQPGDNLWNLAGVKLGDARQWGQIVNDNPFLKSGRRVFVKDGMTYVVIKPGEQLKGLEKLGIVPTISSLDSLVRLRDPVGVYQEKAPNWMLWLLLALAIFALAMIAKYFIDRMLGKNPVTSGPAVVPGGVTAETAPTAFQTTAARQYPGRDVRIARVTRGKMWGVLVTEYADGKRVPRRFNGEHGYRAEVSIDGGPEEQMYMAEGCGNPLRYGGALRFITGEGFRFEADEVAQATPAPVPAPVHEAPVAEVMQVPVVPTPVVDPAVTEEVLPKNEGDRLEVHFDMADGKRQSNLLRVQGKGLKSFTFTLSNDGNPSIRWREADIVATKPD